MLLDLFFKAALTAQQYELGVSSVLPWLYKIMWCHMRNIDLTIGKIFELLDDFPSETVSSTWASFVFGPHRLSFTGGRMTQLSPSLQESHLDSVQVRRPLSDPDGL